MQVQFKLIILLVFFAMGSQPLCAQLVDLEVEGEWETSVLSSEVLEAGKNYYTTLTSATDQILIDLLANQNNNSNIDVRIEVHREDQNWIPDLGLYIRRTGTGSGNGNAFGTMEGGLEFQEVSNVPTFFFFSKKKRRDVPVQLEIRNISVLHPVGVFTTQIVFTMTDL